MLNSRVSPNAQPPQFSKLFWARHRFLRFHLVQNHRMVGFRFSYYGNAFSYLG